MRILVIADLHLDFWDLERRDPLPAIANAAGDVDAVIIAGDLTNNAVSSWPPALARIQGTFPDRALFILPGNHEYYSGHLALDDELRTSAKDAGATFIQKAEFILDDVRFLTCTLWTDFELHNTPDASMARADQGMNDYVIIAKSASDPNAIRPQDTVQIHREHRAWLEERLADPFDGRTVVITHHCPSPAGLHKEHPLSPAFGSDLDQLIDGSGIALWLFGHTHHPFSGSVAGVPIVNVSLNYPRAIFIRDIEQLVKPGVIDTTLPGLLTEI